MKKKIINSMMIIRVAAFIKIIVYFRGKLHYLTNILIFSEYLLLHNSETETDGMAVYE